MQGRAPSKYHFLYGKRWHFHSLTSPNRENEALGNLMLFGSGSHLIGEIPLDIRLLLPYNFECFRLHFAIWHISRHLVLHFL